MSETNDSSASEGDRRHDAFQQKIEDDLQSIRSPIVVKRVPDTERDLGQTYIAAFFAATRIHPEAYLDAEDEVNMHITVVPLDLRSDGKPADGGPRFIKPASPDAMKAFVERNKPWETRDVERQERVQLEGQPWAEDHRWHEADFMLLALRHYALTPDHCYYFNRDINTRFEGPRWHFTFRSVTEIQGWQVCWFLPSINKSKPHFGVFMADCWPLRNDALTTGEMAVASGLIHLRRSYHGFNGHRYIPITIFSASDRQLRVLQVYHDRKDPRTLHVRRSPIMEFWDGAKKNWDDWITILCWAMGDMIEPDKSSEADEAFGDKKMPTQGIVVRSAKRASAGSGPEDH